MKTVKVMLPLLAFVFALVSAFATPYFANPAKGRKPSTGACVGGELIAPPGYLVTDCSPLKDILRCEVIINDQGFEVQVPAYDNGGTCGAHDELYAEFQQ